MRIMAEIKTWKEQTTTTTTLGEELMLMQAEINELRAALVERVPLPDDLFSHKYAWLSALQIARDTALVDLPEIDDKSYWVHEIAVFQRVYAELEATHNIKES